jgi:hypothetical protein
MVNFVARVPVHKNSGACRGEDGRDPVNLDAGKTQMRHDLKERAKQLSQRLVLCLL